jgi:hypothetical protein
MTRLVNAAEVWETVYTAYTSVNFSAFDYNTVKQSLLDYLQLYFPEDFNDYIESSEFIALLELFAYITEQLAYRVDLNANENFINSAQRKESVLRLAQLVSYTPTRNLPARGLVKMTSIQTTETVYDSLGNNLAGVKIVWNDSSNANWKEQFLLVMNLVLEQPFGTVLPSERIQVGDVLFELYTLDNSPLTTSSGAQVFPYTALAAGASQPMEVVPVQLTSNGPIEKRPENNAPFTITYASDGLGDGSPTTGFLMLTKQGTLQNTTTSFDGVTPNQTYDVGVVNINNIDVWLNNIDPSTGLTLTINPLPTSVTSQLTGYSTPYGYWYQVDTTNAQNIIFNTQNNRHLYQIQTNDDDDITLIFGDGEMVDIPNGTFEIWYRASANANITISQNAVQNQTSSFSYVDNIGLTQTFTFAFSLTSSLLNASASETLQHVANTAPSTYSTQDRMVNGQDYNQFMLQDPSILEMRAVNRTFAGDSKYIPWHDPTGSYENVKIFGDDLALYYQYNGPATGNLITVSTNISTTTLLLNYIQPLLSTTDFFTYLAPVYQSYGGNPATLRTTFNTAEQTAILAALNSSAQTIYFYYQVQSPDNWVVNTTGIIPTSSTPNAFYTYMIVVNAIFSGSTQIGWTINYATGIMIAQSSSTDFWNTNNGQATINYDTLNSNQDTVLVLSANINSQGGILGSNQVFNVLSQVPDTTTQSTPDINQLSVLPTDTNGDGIPENMAQLELFNYNFIYTITSSTPANNGRYTITLPQSYVNGYSSQDLIVAVQPTSSTDVPVSDETYYTISNVASSNMAYYNEVNGVNTTVSYQIQIGGDFILADGTTNHMIQVGDNVEVTLVDFVYLNRSTPQDLYVPILTSDAVKVAWSANATSLPQVQTYVRYQGRYPFNFAWFHQTQLYYLVDPAASNIIDMYIITVGYYEALTQWLAGQIDVIPTAPTPLDLRTSYAYLLPNAMISDTVVLQSGSFQLLFGNKAAPQLQATFVVVRPTTNVTLTDNEVANQIVSITQDFFDPNYWEFGETFYFTELATIIQTQLSTEIDTIVLVPLYSTNQFGDLYEIQASQNQLFLADISVSNVQIVTALTPQVLRQAGY